LPHKPKHPCNYPGCPELTHARYCEKHEKQETARQEKERPTSTQRGYSYKWRKYARLFLSDHPLCVNFEDCHRVAALVDHIIPHRGNEALFWKYSNLQPMCKQCHDAKTAKEDGGFGNTERGSI